MGTNIWQAIAYELVYFGAHFVIGFLKRNLDVVSRDLNDAINRKFARFKLKRHNRKISV